ncbi:MAG: DNA polymerase I [Deltaproteobacteria bacterium]|nr:DNA polymerase I [Deltaproteobacteria bacterium]
MTGELKKPTLYLVDGSNYLYRAFYAIRELSNSKGFPTNAIYGFTNMLMKLCREHRPSTVIVSGDKDLMQLVSPDVVMIDTMKDKTYDVAGVRERFGVEPAKVVEVLGLAGDTSDNIPGVPGVGEKTAQKLIQEFGSLEGVYAHLDDIKNQRTRESIREYREQALLSRDLATIRTDASVSHALESLRWKEPDVHALRELFREFEFTTLLKGLPAGDEKETHDYRAVTTDAQLKALVKKLAKAKECGMDILLSAAEEPMRAEILGIAIAAAPNEGCYIPCARDCEDIRHTLPAERVLSSLAPFLGSGKITKHGHDLKTMRIALSRKGFALNGMGCDVMVAAYVLNPSKRDYSLPAITLEHLAYELPPYPSSARGEAKADALSPLSLDEATVWCCRRADIILRLTAVLLPLIEKGGFAELFHDIEMPLVGVLAGMEEKGVLVDVNELREMSAQLEHVLAASEKRIYGLAGEEFNINSPKQLQAVLFDRMKLPRGKKTKGGFSTDVEVLTTLAATYELPAEILAYRSFAKLKSTYIDTLPALINPDTGRVHTSYNQTVTATGRLSSSNPNLQNIPIRTPEGKRIRRAFIAPRGWCIISADYSQIELRILAHLSGDDVLIQVFKSGGDIHTQTASKIFSVFPDMVNPEMRRQAKVINFGIIYGMSPFGLAKELGISQPLARTYIDEYFHRFRDVRRYLDATLDSARRDGYVTTLLNRRRYIPEIMSANAAMRQFAERTAINTPLQGTAADIIKVAMRNVARVLRGEARKTSMIMQVHDELVFEAPENEKENVIALVRREMEGVVELKVPLTVEVSAGLNWDEAH